MSLVLVSVALAQVAPADPVVIVPLTAWVSPTDVDQMRFLQDGREIDGRRVYDERALEVVFHAVRPLATTSPVTFDFPRAVQAAVSVYGPIYVPDLPLAAAPRCDYALDRDEDGLPDCAERPGQMYWGHWLYDYGATIGAKDWFVRVGWQRPQSANLPRPWARPFPEALVKVQETFEEGGITVHFDVGTLFVGPDTDPQYHGMFDLSGLDHGFDYGSVGWARMAPDCNPDYVCNGDASVGGWLDTPATFIEDYRQALVPSDDRVFSFVMFSHQSAGSSGVAQHEGANAVISVTSGSDTILTLDPDPDEDATSWWRPRTATEVYNKTVNYQAGTLMHEMGHLLGLREGGDDRIEAKPNYLSSMSYVYQQTGLPHDGAGVEARYQNWRKGACPVIGGSAIPHGPLGDPDDFWIGFSFGSESALDESDLDETAGFTNDWLAGFPIDWDCDGAIEAAVSTDISGFQLIESNDPDTCGPYDAVPHANQLLNSNDDWSTLELYHRRWFGLPLPNDGLPAACPLP